MTNFNNNKFIVLETTDGGGKDTQAKAIIEYLKSININAIYEHEPTDPETSIGSIIRSILQGKTNCSLYELQRLFTLDRSIHTEKIKKLLEKSWVVCVRHKYSTIAYSMATRKIHPESMTQEELETLVKLNSEFFSAHLTLILDVPAEISMERIESRGEGKELFDKLEFQKSVRQSYLELQENDNTTALIPNGTKQEVSEYCIQEIKKRFEI